MPSYRNTYRAAAPLEVKEWHAQTPAEEYDLNFVYEVPEKAFETPGGMRVEPLIPSLHAPRLFHLFDKFSDGYRFLPYGPFPTYASFLTWLESVRRTEQTLLFVVYDIALDLDNNDEDLQPGQPLREERIAGLVGVLNSRAHDRMTELGHLHIPPPFQRTHVLTHSMALLLHWVLDPPSSSPSSSSPVPHPLGLRRVQWFANKHNLPSITAAKRLAFEQEAYHMTWDRFLPPSKTEGAVELPAFLYGERREVEAARGKGRHSALLGTGWDAWENGGREKVDALVAREVKRRKAKDVPGLLD
ncbi:hypothetical protein JCM8547_002437 [Rhodosporidiobolus lusitaniae]